MDDLETRFDTIRDLLMGELASGEELTMDYSGEHSLFLRFGHGLARQIGEVDSAAVSFRLYRDGKSMEGIFAPSGDREADAALAARVLGRAREDASLLPDDPYRTPSSSTGSSSQRFEGSLPEAEAVVEEVLAPAAGLDFVGIHMQGPVARGAANSSGARHFYAAETFVTDWSVWLPNNKAVKSCYAGRVWEGDEHARRLGRAKERLAPLAKPERRLEPGEYRAFISPEALFEVLPFFSWSGLSERQIREGESAYIALREGRKSFSPAFSLSQDFSLGVEPRFNEAGDLAPERLVLIDRGKLAATLVSERSAKEYGIPSNAAPEYEGLRSPSMAAGELAEAEALAALGTGVYVANFHYLNWSDVETARVTGMTRFACFWVEEGKIVAPIKDMRFDESLYDLLGGKLEAVTRERSLVTETASYGFRSVGGALLPGLLVSGLRFTL
jgi:predicted Zn-dependent protease